MKIKNIKVYLFEQTAHKNVVTNASSCFRLLRTIVIWLNKSKRSQNHLVFVFRIK